MDCVEVSYVPRFDYRHQPLTIRITTGYKTGVVVWVHEIVWTGKVPTTFTSVTVDLSGQTVPLAPHI